MTPMSNKRQGPGVIDIHEATLSIYIQVRAGVRAGRTSILCHGSEKKMEKRYCLGAG